MNNGIRLLIVIMFVFVLVGCDNTHEVKHFEAPLAVHIEEGVEVVYRITFPEMVEYRYNKFTSGRDLRNYDPHFIAIESETIGGVCAFEWIDTHFRENHDVKETDERCMYAVELEEHTLCYRDLRDRGPDDLLVSVYIEYD